MRITQDRHKFVTSVMSRIMMSTAVMVISLSIINASGISVTRITQQQQDNSRRSGLLMGFHSMDSVIEAEESQPNIITIDKHGKVSVAKPEPTIKEVDHPFPELAHHTSRRIFKRKRKGDSTILLLPGAEPEPKYEISKYEHPEPYVEPYSVHEYSHHSHHPYHGEYDHHHHGYHHHRDHHHHSYSPYSASVVHHHQAPHQGHHHGSPHPHPSHSHPSHPLPPPPSLPPPPPPPAPIQPTQVATTTPQVDSSCYVNVCKPSRLKKTIQKAVKKGVDQSLKGSIRDILNPFLTDLGDLLSRELPPGMANRFKDDVRELADKAYERYDRSDTSDY